MTDRPAGEVLNWIFTDTAAEIECAVCPLGALGWSLASIPKNTWRAEIARLAFWEYGRQHLALAHGIEMNSTTPPVGSSSNDAGRNGPPFSHPDDDTAWNAPRRDP